MANIFPNLTQTMNAQTRDGQWKQPLETWRQLHQDSSQPSCSKTLRKCLTSSQRNKTRHTGRHKKKGWQSSCWKRGTQPVKAKPVSPSSTPRERAFSPQGRHRGSERRPDPSRRPPRNTRGLQVDGDDTGGHGSKQRRRSRKAPLGHGHVPHLPRVLAAVPCPRQSSRGRLWVVKRQLTSGSLREILATLHQINPF